MRKFCILRNTVKDPSGEFTRKVTEYLKKNDRISTVSNDGDDIPDDADCVIVRGGDGTLLRAADKVVDRQIPLLGVNLGTLGYLAEVNRAMILPALDKVMNNDFDIEKRMMIYGTIYHDGIKVCSGNALNDIVITRTGPPRILKFMNYVNNEFLNSYQADGIIISTPTGSTGYSLSAGGPIVSPQADLLILTPLAPHTINTRSIIFPKSDEIMVEIGPGRTPQPEAATVNFDGEGDHRVETGDRIVVRMSRKGTNIIKISNLSFLEVLRKKMSSD